jgi:DNA-binding transcriptional ArsR family regulator
MLPPKDSWVENYSTVWLYSCTRATIPQVPSQPPFPSETVDALAERFRLLSEPSRLRLLCMLAGGERCVGDLAVELGCTQANVSKHLAMLADAGLLRRRKAGLNCYYSVADESVFTVCGSVWDSLRRHRDAAAEAVRVPD